MSIDDDISSRMEVIGGDSLAHTAPVCDKRVKVEARIAKATHDALLVHNHLDEHPPSSDVMSDGSINITPIKRILTDYCPLDEETTHLPRSEVEKILKQIQQASGMPLSTERALGKKRGRKDSIEEGFQAEERRVVRTTTGKTLEQVMDLFCQCLEKLVPTHSELSKVYAKFSDETFRKSFREHLSQTGVEELKKIELEIRLDFFRFLEEEMNDPLCQELYELILQSDEGPATTFLKDILTLHMLQKDILSLRTQPGTDEHAISCPPELLRRIEEGMDLAFHLHLHVIADTLIDGYPEIGPHWERLFEKVIPYLFSVRGLIDTPIIDKVLLGYIKTVSVEGLAHPVEEFLERCFEHHQPERALELLRNVLQSNVDNEKKRALVGIFERHKEFFMAINEDQCSFPIQFLLAVVRENFSSFLFKATKAGNWHVIQDVLSFVPEDALRRHINDRDQDGHTVLYNAFFHREMLSADVIERFVQFGAIIEPEFLEIVLSDSTFNLDRHNVLGALLHGVDRWRERYSYQFFDSIIYKIGDEAIRNMLKEMRDTFPKPEAPLYHLRLPVSEDIRWLYEPIATKLLVDMREPLRQAVKRQDYRGYIKTLKSFEPLHMLFFGSAQVREGYTVEEHTRRVFGQFLSQRRFFPCAEIEQALRKRPGFERFDINGFLFALLAFHDIGKSQGEKASEQHLFTTPVISVVFGALGFSPAEVQLAQTLIDNDVLGEWQKEKITDSVDMLFQLTSLSAKAGIDLETYFQLQKILFISDSSSYPAIREQHMLQDPKTGQLRFKPSDELGRPSRTEYVEEVVRSPDIGSLDSVMSSLQTYRISAAEHPLLMVTMWFDFLTWNGKKNIFEMAGLALANEARIRAQFGELIADEIVKMARYCIALQQDGYTAEHTTYSIQARILLREKPIMDAFNGARMGDHFDIFSRPEFQEVFSILQTYIGCEDMEDLFNYFYGTNDSRCHPFKLLSCLSRTSPTEAYVWTKSPEGAYRQLEKFCKQKHISIGQAQKAFAALQAYSVELLERLDFPGKNPDGTVDIVRTEDEALLSRSYGLPEGRGIGMARSALDCASIGTCVVCYGTGITHSRVPFHRVVGGFFGAPGTLFGNPIYNGITFQPEGVSFNYYGRLASKELIDQRGDTFQPIPGPLSEEDARLMECFHIIPITYVDEVRAKRKVYLSFWQKEQDQIPADLYDRLEAAYHQ